ncbi:MAG: cation diffusion facilitator family transporter [Gemmatimonadaceae bacterium]
MTSPRNTPPPLPSLRASRTPAVREVLLVILVLNVVVVAAKVVIGVRTGALAVLGAALDSGLDILSNVIGMVLVGLAARAPDDDHPYGHDKFETLGALGIVGFISISCYELAREGIEALMHARPTREPGTAEIVVLLCTAAVNVFVVWYERRRGRTLGSAFLLADAEHTRGDIYVTVLALASLVFTRLGYPRIDAVLALVVALLLGWSGVQVLRQSVPILVDQRAIDAEEIRGIVNEVTGIVEVGTVRSRWGPSGLLFAEVTVGVPGVTPVARAHEIADAVEAKMAERLGATQVTVHIEPA